MDDSKFHNEPGQKQPITGGQKPGRNDPCPCGSGSKWKKCHGSAEKHTKAMAVAKEAYYNEMARLVMEDVASKMDSTDTNGKSVWDVDKKPE